MKMACAGIQSIEYAMTACIPLFCILLFTLNGVLISSYVLLRTFMYCNVLAHVLYSDNIVPRRFGLLCYCSISTYRIMSNSVGNYYCSSIVNQNYEAYFMHCLREFPKSLGHLHTEYRVLVSFSNLCNTSSASESDFT